MSFKQLLANTEFSIGAARPSDFPSDQGIEVAFAGRSNAGKSSVLNKICARKQLARTSKTPGRTQQINFFSISPTMRLVDLPGYGYAKASHDKQRQWTQLLEQYFDNRTALRGAVLVMDIRHPLREVDQAMLDWCWHHRCDVHILLNKCDKLSRNQASRQLQLVSKQLPKHSEISTSMQLFSAHNGEGLAQVITQLAEWFNIN